MSAEDILRKKDFTNLTHIIVLEYAEDDIGKVDLATIERFKLNPQRKWITIIVYSREVPKRIHIRSSSGYVGTIHQQLVPPTLLELFYDIKNFRMMDDIINLTEEYVFYLVGHGDRTFCSFDAYDVLNTIDYFHYSYVKMKFVYLLTCNIGIFRDFLNRSYKFFIMLGSASANTTGAALTMPDEFTYRYLFNRSASEVPVYRPENSMFWYLGKTNYPNTFIISDDYNDNLVIPPNNTKIFIASNSQHIVIKKITIKNVALNHQTFISQWKATGGTRMIDTEIIYGTLYIILIRYDDGKNYITTLRRTGPSGSSRPYVDLKGKKYEVWSDDPDLTSIQIPKLPYNEKERILYIANFLCGNAYIENASDEDQSMALNVFNCLPSPRRESIIGIKNSIVQQRDDWDSSPIIPSARRLSISEWDERRLSPCSRRTSDVFDPTEHK